MKKIILAFDSVHFSEGAFEFARRLNEINPILLTGIFLPQAELANLWSYADGAPGIAIPLLEPAESVLVEQNIKRFEKLCSDNLIDHRVHKNYYDFVMPELRKESRFADLLILGSEAFYENTGTGSPNDYLQEVLHDVVCPVLVVPEKFEFPESIILGYDGTENAVFAIKQFAYLFPELVSKETVLVFASENKKEDFPDKSEIEELVARHFGNLTLYKLEVNPGKYFHTWISEKKSAIFVSGSYGRSGISQLFKKSFVKDIIGDYRLPVFIAHR